MNDPLALPPNSLDELFSRDPLDLTDDDLLIITQHLREARAKWQAAEQAPKAARRTAAPKGGVNIDLSDLFDS